jgi:hypothetical protein
MWRAVAGGDCTGCSTGEGEREGFGDEAADVALSRRPFRASSVEAMQLVPPEARRAAINAKSESLQNTALQLCLQNPALFWVELSSRTDGSVPQQ